jgi:transcriptional regulator with XRE-family HTH domain
MARRPNNRSIAEQLNETGRRITQARKALELSQVEICRNIEVGETTWNNWERGKRVPDPFVMAKFAEHYGVTLDWVYRGDREGLSHRLLNKLLEVERGT